MLGQNCLTVFGKTNAWRHSQSINHETEAEKVQSNVESVSFQDTSNYVGLFIRCYGITTHLTSNLFCIKLIWDKLILYRFLRLTALKYLTSWFIGVFPVFRAFAREPLQKSKFVKLRDHWSFKPTSLKFESECTQNNKIFYRASTLFLCFEKNFKNLWVDTDKGLKIMKVAYLIYWSNQGTSSVFSKAYAMFWYNMWSLPIWELE